MSGLTLHVDAERWRHHIMHFVARYHGNLVPVIKGNGYGFGLPTLAREAANFSAAVVACYNVDEAAVIRSQFAGDVLLLSPTERLDEDWIIHTIAPISETFENNAPKRFLLEMLSPVYRHGFAVSEIAPALADFGKTGKCLGIAIHLPINQKSSMVKWIDEQLKKLDTEKISSDLYDNTIWVSHLTAEDLTTLKNLWPTIRWKNRIGTDLWLGARTSLTATATVIDRHRLTAGARIGYRQLAPGKGWLLIVAGGTGQGIGLEFPNGGLKNLIKSGLRLFGWNPSPYSWNGKALAFAEAPHMHNSLLYIGADKAPEVGEEIGLTVRFTTTSFDEIVFE